MSTLALKNSRVDLQNSSSQELISISQKNCVKLLHPSGPGLHPVVPRLISFWPIRGRPISGWYEYSKWVNAQIGSGHLLSHYSSPYHLGRGGTELLQHSWSLLQRNNGQWPLLHNSAVHCCRLQDWIIPFTRLEAASRVFSLLIISVDWPSKQPSNSQPIDRGK